jgi:hypothetical protein
MASSLLGYGALRPRAISIMTGRRRHARYLLTEPIEGSLRVREDVAIERWDDNEVVVISSTPSRPADTLTLELPGVDPRHVVVTVAESRPVVAPDGSLRHRLLLTVRSGAGNGHGRETL